MRKLVLSAAILLALATAPLAARRHGGTAYTPPAEPGQIFTVIDFPRAQGKAQNATINIAFGEDNRSILALAPRYQNPCVTARPAGVVLRLRHSTPDPTPLTLTTNGIVLRGPYQGDPPEELLHACYTLVK
jgi:hypothetical protein